jgi:hypothetical protein
MTNPCNFSFDRNKTLVAQFAASAPPPVGPEVVTGPQIDCAQHFIHHYDPFRGYTSPEAQRTCAVPQIDSECASTFGARGVPYSSSVVRRHRARW